MTTNLRHFCALSALFLGGVLFAACSVAGAGAGSGDTGNPNVLSPGQVVLGNGGVSGLHRPVVGRLAGYEFTLTVLGYDLTPSTGPDGMAAPAGSTLAIVDYDLTYYDNGTSVPDLAFFAGGQVDDIGDGPPATSSGESSALALVPKGQPVEFRASLDGVTQAFSLTTGSRVGTSPSVLYRDPAGGSDVTDTVGKTVPLGVEDPTASSPETEELTVSSATLTYFSPVDPGVHPASPAGAFLVVNGTDRAAGALDASWSAAMPPGRLSLVLPDGKVLHPDWASTANTDYALDLLDGQYFFDVPAGFTRGTLVIAPGTNLTIGPGDGNPIAGPLAMRAVALVGQSRPSRTPPA